MSLYSPSAGKNEMSDQSPNSCCTRVSPIALFVLALGLCTTVLTLFWTRSQARLSELVLIGVITLFLLLAFATQLVIIGVRYSQRLSRETTSRSEIQEELTWTREQLAIQVRRRVEIKRINVLLECELEEHRRAEECLRELNSCLLRLQDEEKRRLARDLPDVATPGLVALRFDIPSDGANLQTLERCAN